MARVVAGLKLRRQEVTAGPLTVVIETDDTGRLHSVNLPKRVPAGLSPEHLASVLRELERYIVALDDSRPFYQKVWLRMRKISWGSTLTYGAMAAAIGHPQASRAVGQACAANPLPLVIPCHRITGTRDLGGFAWGLGWKAKLLELEIEPPPRS